MNYIILTILYKCSKRYNNCLKIKWKGKSKRMNLIFSNNLNLISFYTKNVL